jgi:hypothetical protein
LPLREVAAQRSMGDAQRAFDDFRSDRVGDFAQWQMGRGQRNADDVVGEHHHHIAPGLRGEQLGRAGVGDAAFVDRGLMYGAGHHAIEIATQAARRGFVQGTDQGAGVTRIGSAEDGMRRVGDFPYRKFARVARRLACRHQRQWQG